MAKIRLERSAKLNSEFYRYCLTENFPFVVDLEGSRGAYLKTADGQYVFDWAGYYGSKLIGHNHPGLFRREYLKRLVYAANNKVPNPDYLTQPCLDFYKEIFKLAPAQMRKSRELEVYAVNSGAEAVENMLKYLISRYNSRVGKSARLAKRHFITFRNSFHGRTIFALSITSVPNRIMTKDFHPLFRSNIKLDFPVAVFSGLDPAVMRRYNERVSERTLDALEAVLRRHSDEVVAVIIEPIQSAGGSLMATDSFFHEMSRLAARHDAYLGFDEVQTGLGASGKLFYVDHLKLKRPPQAVATAKKFGVGVLYMLDHLVDVGVLDSTWGGPLVDMVRVMQELKIVEQERLFEKTAGNGERLLAGLRALEERFPDCIFNVRGRGYLQGFTVLPNATGEARDLLVKIALEDHLLLLSEAGPCHVRLRPNLSTTRKDIDRFLSVMEDCLVDFRRKRPKGWADDALRLREGPVWRLMGQKRAP